MKASSTQLEQSPTSSETPWHLCRMKPLSESIEEIVPRLQGISTSCFQETTKMWQTNIIWAWTCTTIGSTVGATSTTTIKSICRTIRRPSECPTGSATRRPTLPSITALLPISRAAPNKLWQGYSIPIISFRSWSITDRMTSSSTLLGYWATSTLWIGSTSRNGRPRPKRYGVSTVVSIWDGSRSIETWTSWWWGMQVTLRLRIREGQCGEWSTGTSSTAGDYMP